jgi:putative PEP-CTERM system TPR-repeat lipoprotein
MALISMHLRRQDFDKALKAIDGLEKKQPESPLAWNLRGRIQIAQNNKTAARKSFEEALKITPTYFPAVASLALLDVADKKPDDARARFENVLKKDPKNVQALLALAEMRANNGGSEQEISDLIGKAIAASPSDPTPKIILVSYYIKNKNFKLALTTAQNAVSALPENADVLDALGRAQQASGDTNQALSTYNKLAAMQPSSPQPFMRMAEINFAAKNNDSAIQNVNKALELKPDFVAAQQALILLNNASGKYQESVAVARSIQKKTPKSAIGYMLEGDIYAQQKKWDDSLSAYKMAFKQSGALDAGVKIHSVLVASGNKDEASKFAASWVKDHPKDVAFVFHLADFSLAKNDLVSAEKLFTSIVQIQPENALAYNNLAWVSGQLKKDTAVGFAEKANDIARNEPAFMDTLAVLLSEKGESSRAIDLQKKVVSLQPNNMIFKFNLAKIYVKSNDKKQAKEILDELAKLGDKYPGQKEVSELLKQI